MGLNIEKKDIYTSVVSILLFLLAGFGTIYIDINSRIKTLEITIHALEIKYDQYEANMTETRQNISDIKDLIHSIDKKVAVNEERAAKK